MQSKISHCEIHDEIEPHTHDEILWVCPECSKENLTKITDETIRKIKEHQ